MSPNYIILSEFPLVVNSIDLLLWLKPYIENFRWEPQRGTPFTIVNRHTGKIAGRFECDPFFAFHHVNAFEREGELLVDLVAYDNADIIQSYYLNRLNDEQSGAALWDAAPLPPSAFSAARPGDRGDSLRRLHGAASLRL
jgi:beta,beta-carotene 9',10'-dioxygenase